MHKMSYLLDPDRADSELSTRCTNSHGGIFKGVTSGTWVYLALRSCYKIESRIRWELHSLSRSSACPIYWEIHPESLSVRMLLIIGITLSAPFIAYLPFFGLCLCALSYNLIFSVRAAVLCPVRSSMS